MKFIKFFSPVLAVIIIVLCVQAKKGTVNKNTLPKLTTHINQPNDIVKIPQIFYPPISPNANTYYVSSMSGSDGNSGRSKSSPFASINRALQVCNGGDVIYVASGTYNEFVTITKGGSPSGYTCLFPIPGSKDRPKIIANATTYQNTGSAIDIKASYVHVGGFDVTRIDDQSNPKTFSSGIAVHGKAISANGTYKPLVHHIFLDNNVVHDIAAGGISTSHADYITLYQNIVYGNAKWAPNQTSGISLWGLLNFDDAPGFHNLIVGNQSYGNVVLVNPNYKTPDGSSHQGTCTTDGNGIIIDDSRRTQQPDKAPYHSETLIFGNLVYNNGGRGIVVYESDNVSVVNNTLYHNMSSPKMCNPEKQGDLVASYSGNVRFVNNIIQSSGGTSNALVETSVVNEHLLENNLISGNIVIENKHITSLPPGSNNITGVDPKFKFPSTDPRKANFELSGDSPAISIGKPLNTSQKDISGRSIQPMTKVNLGAILAN